MIETNRRVSCGNDYSLHRLLWRSGFKQREGAAMRNLLILILLLMAAVPSRASTYYISKSSGADSNSGTAKGAAWAHLPGMASWTGSHTPAAGDTFILMGCDTWVNSDLPILWNWSGSAGSPITIGGEDQTWYNTAACPSAWNRPVFDAQKEAIAGQNVIFIAAYSGNTSYVTLDSVEMKGLYCAGACTFGQVDYINSYNTTTNWILSNLYLHGWNVVTDGECVIVNFFSGSLFTTGIIDGSDATGASPAGATCYAFYASLPNITNSVIHDLANGIVGYETPTGHPVTISGNLIYNIKESNAGSHPNAIYTMPPGTYYVHDNIVHDCAGESYYFGYGKGGETDYVWNNIWYNILGNPPEGGGSTPGASFYAYNNTVVPPSGGSCFQPTLQDGYTYSTVVIENTHCISTGVVSPSLWGSLTPTLTTNLLMSPTTAATDGYTSSRAYVYSPTSSGSPTVGAGTNLTSECSGSLASLCSDTAYAVFYNSIAQSVTVPARTSNGRPSSGNWGVGAYQYGDPSPPASATNLQATPH